MEKLGAMVAVNLQKTSSARRVTWNPDLETNAPYIPQGTSAAERGFGTIIVITRSLLLGSLHHPKKLWGAELKGAVNIKNRTPTDVLGGKALPEV